MPTNHAASLVHLLGFIAGAALYAMLLVMVVRSRSIAPRAAWFEDRLPLLTAVLGLAWNVGGLAAYAHRDLLGGEPLPLVVAASYTALGFLPAVVVHAALAGRADMAAWARPAVAGAVAYGLGVVAGAMHFASAIESGRAPSNAALTLLSAGFALLTVAIIAGTRREAGWGRAVWVVALAVFAVTALHLGSDAGHDSWWVELLGHHASLPLAIAILYQDYRFALADIFLKRALLLLALVAVSCLAYLGIDPLLAMRTATGETDPRAVSAVVGILVLTALVYPALRGAVWWFVDAVVLRRGDYAALRADVAIITTSHETPDGLLDAACARLGVALDASTVTWREVAGAPHAPADPWLFATEVGGHAGTLRVPTAESPEYEIRIDTLEGGRRILSDDVAALESVANAVARRIDALRVDHERCERNVREQEMGKLATEAELRALRAQLNPHFLFNALTTIGYLIQTSPERALDTLMRLTGLLRAVLKQPGGSVTLGEELDLVEAYLAIERARFEERLRVAIDVPAALREIHVPLLVVQPLVENAVKHGISPLRGGGEVSVSARLDAMQPDVLVLRVADSGAGVGDAELAERRLRGVGLANVERRLEMTYGDRASLAIASEPGRGTAVEVRLPAERGTLAVPLEAARRRA